MREWIRKLLVLLADHFGMSGQLAAAADEQRRQQLLSEHLERGKQLIAGK